MRIEVTEHPAQADAKRVSAGIVAFNQRIIGDAALEEDLRYHVFAKNDSDEVVGGIRAVAYWNWLQIELLWLEEGYRGRGLGTRLLANAEAYAMTNHFFLSRVETTSFQARAFYEKQGYIIFAELDDYPVGHTTIMLKKKLILPG